MSELKRRLLDPLAWIISRKRMIDLLESAGSNIESIVELPNLYYGRGFYARIHAEQDPKEIHEMAALVAKKNPRVIVEIGTYKGGTLLVWTRASGRAELVVSVDLPGGKYGGGYDARREKLYRLFAHGRAGTRMEFIRANSHEETTKESLASILAGRKIDFLYIDADHTYEGVKKDFELYSPLMSKGGIIGFHDIKNAKENHQVKVFWNEIKGQYQHLEIVGPGTRTGNGVLFL